jgi:8-oxo-dGTP diphosphatase
MLSVVAAVIEANGKVLVCQRRRGDTFELMWEFPGGKVKASETPQQALARELREELGADAEIGVELFRTTHRYAELGEPIDLTFFSASLAPDTIRNLAFEAMEWRAAETLLELNFLPADVVFVEMLARKRPSCGITPRSG